MKLENLFGKAKHRRDPNKEQSRELEPQLDETVEDYSVEKGARDVEGVEKPNLAEEVENLPEGTTVEDIKQLIAESSEAIRQNSESAERDIENEVSPELQAEIDETTAEAQELAAEIADLTLDEEMLEKPGAGEIIKDMAYKFNRFLDNHTWVAHIVGGSAFVGSVGGTAWASNKVLEMFPKAEAFAYKAYPIVGLCVFVLGAGTLIALLNKLAKDVDSK